MNFKENDAFKLDDGTKYWLVKIVNIDNFKFYYTIKIADKAEIVIFLDLGERIEKVEDEEILKSVLFASLNELDKR